VQPDEIVDADISVQDNEPINLIYGNLIDSDVDKLAVGLRVEAVFDRVTEGTTLLRWRVSSE
jgi:uncharacterized OB-fold protein